MNAILSPTSFTVPPASSQAGTFIDTFADTVADTLGGMLRWFAHGSASAVLPMQRTSLRQTQNARKLPASTFVAKSALPVTATSHSGSQALRVLRLQEAGQARSSVGRMVISGRMADVCAELDRLVSCEGHDAARH